MQEKTASIKPKMFTAAFQGIKLSLARKEVQPDIKPLIRMKTTIVFKVISL